MTDQPLQVTEPFLPPLEEYVEFITGIWDRNVLTNKGPLCLELEDQLKAYHQIDMPVYSVANGGLGLQIILKSMGIKGEVITTPFSYIATTSCPLWEGCTVKFADIEPGYLTIDPAAVEAAISPDTEAILATHVFGNPCDCEALKTIANKHGLAIIYDAAHAIARETEVADKIEWMRRFGHKGTEAFHGVGINAKLSELHAAMGLCNMRYLSEILEKRKVACDAYDQALFGQGENSLTPLRMREATSWNYSYYPVLFESEKSLLQALAYLQHRNINPRRYFYPDLLTGLGGKAEHCPVTTDVSRRVLCLPLSHKTDSAVVDAITSAVKRAC
jgi:dTDP-4-amino-4,6-dideoxygalactose transaminase